MANFGTLIVAVIVTLILLGGPLTLYAFIKILNSAFGSVKARFVKLAPKEAGDPTLGLLIDWDQESFEEEVFRVRVDFFELVRGGRAASFSYTFEGKAAKKRSFVIPMKLSPIDLEVLTDKGFMNLPHSVQRSFAQIEVENTRGEARRFKIPKAKIVEALMSATFQPDASIEVMPPRAPDDWALLTRVFPWKTAIAKADEPAAGDKKAAPKAKGSAGPSLVDFLVTKVWIEPGCIVCDACENEAPLVFQVLADTCIVRENAPLDDGGSIKAAAEGCPVDVIKFETKPKPAGASAPAAPV